MFAGYVFEQTYRTDYKGRRQYLQENLIVRYENVRYLAEAKIYGVSGWHLKLEATVRRAGSETDHGRTATTCMSTKGLEVLRAVIFDAHTQLLCARSLLIPQYKRQSSQNNPPQYISGSRTKSSG